MDFPRLHSTLLVIFLLAASAASAGAQAVRGVLVDEHTGHPVALGKVMLVDADRDSVAATLTTDQGLFQLTAPRAGSYSILAGGFGYWSALIGPFEIREGEVRIVETRVAARPMQLRGLTVETQGAHGIDEPRLGYLVSSGFYDRLASERGEFITPGEIAAADATYIQQLFYTKRSTRVFETPSVAPITARQLARALWKAEVRNISLTGRQRRSIMQQSTTARRWASPSRIGPWGNVVTIRRPSGGHCVPWLYVDGVRVRGNPGETLADMVPIETVLGVEIYRAPFEGTLKFRDISRCECGALVVWTNQAQ